MIGWRDFWRANHFHLSEDTLVRLVARELPAVRRVLARCHIGLCSGCRSRYRVVEQVVLELFEQHKQAVKYLEPLSPVRRKQFIQQLDLLIESLPARRWWANPLERLGFRPFGNAPTAFVAPLILICACVVVFFVGHSRLPVVSASEFLNRAVASEIKPLQREGTKVIRQRLRIRTTNKTFEESVYRAVSGRIKPPKTVIDQEQRELANRLELAGVNWDDPLSAVSFRIWHDAQAEAADEVHSSGEGLLTITTRVPLTAIVQESLTVREDSFRPIQRTIAYREFGTVDISEVSTEVLTAEAANQLFAESQPEHREVVPRAHASALLPNSMQMNETELQARLILNRENADTGEQIEVLRDTRGIQIRGLVENVERKKQLEDSLRGIPFLNVTLKGFDEIQAVPAKAGQVAVESQQPVEAKTSRLEKFFLQQGRDRDDLGRISAGLFDVSLAINRSSQQLEQISSRFSAGEELSPVAVRAQRELMLRITERLIGDLNVQRRLIGETQIKIATEMAKESHRNSEPADLVHLAARNVFLTKELITSGSEPDRAVEDVVTELNETIFQLRAVALQLSPQAQ